MKVFPTAKWEPICYPSQPDSPDFWHCQITGAELTKNKNKLLYITRLPKPFWNRTYMASDTALNLSMINWDDVSTDINAPLPPEANVVLGNETVKLESDIQVNKTGDYEVECKTHNRTIVIIDHKKIFNISFLMIGDYTAPTADKKIHLNLTSGEHHVEVIVSFQIESKYPEITLRPAGSSDSGQSLWKSFVFN
jgi:hypothetical protein